MQQTEANQSPQEPRDRLLPNRITLEEIAEEIGGCERSARNLAERLKVPYVKLVGVRLYDREKFRTAILASEVNAAARGRGRPRKAA
jgi:hypothetical protein